MTDAVLWLIIIAMCVGGWLIACCFKRWERRADRAILAQLDAALLHGADWTDDEQASADCLDCAAASDGSHDRVRLSLCERITFDELERRLEETR
jgi:hypothetical protein